MHQPQSLKKILDRHKLRRTSFSVILFFLLLRNYEFQHTNVENYIPRHAVLGGAKSVAHFLTAHNRLNKTNQTPFQDLEAA